MRLLRWLRTEWRRFSAWHAALKRGETTQSYHDWLDGERDG
jgi:hypothetical protein